MALVDLAEDDQRHGQMIEKPQPAVEVDGQLRRLDSLRLAAVRQRAVGDGEVRVEPRLEAEIAHFLRGLEPPEAGLDAAARVERAVEYAEVGVTAAGRLQQVVRLGEPDALLDLVDRLVEAARARKRHAERVVGLRPRCRRLTGALRVGRVSSSLAASASARSAQAMAPALSPTRNASRPTSWKSCARSMGLPSSPSCSRPDAKQALARSRSPASQCRPPILRCRRAAPARSAAASKLLPHRLIVREGLGPLSGQRQQIREPLARRLHLALAALAAGEGAQSALGNGGWHRRWHRPRAPGRRQP